MKFDDVAAATSLFVRRRRACLPDFVGGTAAESARVLYFIGQPTCRLDVFRRPAARSTVAGGQVMSARLKAADPGFAGAVVARGIRGREQDGDAPGGEQVLRLLGDEGRTVVALEHERRTVLEEEGFERRGGVFGGGCRNGEPSELLAARQVADREQGPIEAVDRERMSKRRAERRPYGTPLASEASSASQLATDHRPPATFVPPFTAETG